MSTHNTLAHAGKPGMKWGYNDGQRNGKRTAEEKKPWESDINHYEWLKSLPIYGLLSSDVTVKESIERGQAHIKENGYTMSLGVHTIRRRK